jgi:hypothetical protein
LTEKLKELFQGQDNQRYRLFYGKFRAEFQDITAAIARVRSPIVAYVLDQTKLVPVNVTDIDEWIDQNAPLSPDVEKLRLDRQKLIFEADAMFYRICLFTSLASYAVEATLSDINQRLNDLGFPIEVVLPLRKPWDVLVIGGLTTLAVCLGLSLIYTVLVEDWPIPVPDSYKQNVPKDLKEAGVWAVTAAVMHTAAAVAAVLLTIREMKANRAKGRDLVSHNPITRNIVVACYSSLFPVAIITVFALSTARSLESLCWIVLPFITAYFSGGYIRRSVSNNPQLPRGIVLQTVSMALAGLVLSIILVPNDSIANCPPIVWVFTAYAMVTAMAIGITLGGVFWRNLGVNCDRLFAVENDRVHGRLTFVPHPS